MICSSFPSVSHRIASVIVRGSLSLWQHLPQTVQEK
jgi:hypothetical protein